MGGGLQRGLRAARHQRFLARLVGGSRHGNQFFGRDAERSTALTHTSGRLMDILFLLVPFSVLLALGVVGLLAWAIWSGQFEDVESEGQRIFQDSIVESDMQDPSSRP